jgi:hypothetical protein
MKNRARIGGVESFVMQSWMICFRRNGERGSLDAQRGRTEG